MTLDFEDKNLPIPFKTTISKLTGEVSAVKNRANSTSNLEINGVVDNYGVAKITGIVNPNNIKLLTDVNMKFKNISMKNFTPYTAKFVGRAIKDGKLELDLNYNISESNLKAKNSIIIKKLELGEKIESKDAVSLPLDLAITLLEDSSNTIDLNLPVSGNVDDPEFSIAAIVWKAFVNLITKAITAPFSLIGSLFNFSEDEINSVDFNLKESEITPIQKETLDKIALILNSKKEFAISFSPSFDEKNEKEKIANQILKISITNQFYDCFTSYVEKINKKTSQLHSKRLAITSAVMFVRFVNILEKKEINQIIVDQFCWLYWGQRASLTGFINHLNIYYDLKLIIKDKGKFVFEKRRESKVRLEQQIISILLIAESTVKNHLLQKVFTYMHNIEFPDDLKNVDVVRLVSVKDSVRLKGITFYLGLGSLNFTKLNATND